LTGNDSSTSRLPVRLLVDFFKLPFGTVELQDNDPSAV
jgi:hypothetical protein